MARGPVSAAALADAAGVDRSTVTRALSRYGDELLVFGAARSTRYALRRPVFTAGNRWGIFRIGESGGARHWATLEAFHDRRWRVRWEDKSGPPEWASFFSDEEGLWEGFPFFLADLRPQGFLGRSIARHLSRFLGFPQDPRQWSDDHTVQYLQSAGEDVPGSLVLGEESLRRALEPDVLRSVPASACESLYPELADDAIRLLPGSSAGGEQPKFLARVEEADGALREVLVKFSPPLDQPVGRRWADLLACEGMALQVLGEAGLARSGARLIDAGGRRFLELPRFDRTAEGGRAGVVSLSALVPESDVRGSAEGWLQAAGELERAGWIDSMTRTGVARLHAFGEWIGNTDMHSGNLAFWMGDTLPIRLAPAYDMLPMQWAPGPQGEIADREFTPPPILPDRGEARRETREWALDFWQRVMMAPEVSEEFRGIARSAREKVLGGG